MDVDVQLKDARHRPLTRVDVRQRRQRALTDIHGYIQYMQILLWSPYVIGQTIIFSSCGYFFFFLSLPNLSARRLDVYHTSTHGVALVYI